jgi:hypothetical protein
LAFAEGLETFTAGFFALDGAAFLTTAFALAGFLDFCAMRLLVF